MRRSLLACFAAAAVLAAIPGCGSDAESSPGAGGEAGDGGSGGVAGDGGAGGAAGMGGDAGSGGEAATGGNPRQEDELLGEGWELVCKLGLCEEDPELGVECQEVYDACLGRGHYPRSCRMDADRMCGVFGETGPF